MINFKIIFIAALSFCLVPAAFQVRAQSQAPSLGTFDPDRRYRLQPGDVLEVQYRYTPEFNQVVTVQPDGFVALSLVGDTKVGEQTVEQARSLIQKKASVRLNDPEVVLILKEFQKPYFVVAGQVVQPGKIEMREKITALQAVLLAGGFKETARSSQILIFRKLNAESAEVINLDLKKIRKTGDLERNLLLEPGDMLYVPENTITKINRFMTLAHIALYFDPLRAFLGY